MEIVRFKNLSISQKLLLSYVLLIAIPIIFLSILSYNAYARFLEKRVTDSYQAVNIQITENLDTFFRNLAQLTRFPYYDYEIRDIMEKDYSKQSYPDHEKVQDYKRINEGFFSRLALLNNFIDSMYLYHMESNTLFTYGINRIITYDFSEKSRVVEKNGDEVILGLHKKHPDFSDSVKVISVERLLKKPYDSKRLGVFGVNVVPARLKELYKEVKYTPNSRQLIVDENNLVVYCNINEDIGGEIEPEIMQYLVSGTNSVKGRIRGKEVYIVTNTSQYTAWKVISIIPEEELLKDTVYIKHITLLLGLILLSVAVVSSLFIARGLSSPIQKLSSTMKQVEAGNLDVKIEIAGKDEIGHLSMAFNKMVKEVKRLMEKTIIDGEKKRIAELNALQYQINPHFMYNTLNVIKWMAKMQAADNITDSLDSFMYILKFSARFGEEYIPVTDELDFIRNYISILRTRYYNKFNVEYAVDGGLLKYKVLKFLLQPLIENAIFHGFNEKKSGYVLKIEGRLENSTIVFKIIDNGSGMNSDSIKKVLSPGEGGRKGFNSIGLKNVMERIELHFGKGYGVDIHSIPGEGTVVSVSVPAVPLEDVFKIEAGIKEG